MTDITAAIDDSQKCLTVAASGVIGDYSDGTAQIVFFGDQMARAFCYEAIRMADDLPGGWRRKVTAAPFPGFPPLCCVWFPREQLLTFNHRQETP